MANITQSISNFPTAPNSATDTPTEFNTKADAFVYHQANNYVGEVNQWATEANSLKGDMNAIKQNIDDTIALLPNGSINDSTISPTTTWSSEKLDALGVKDYTMAMGNVNAPLIDLPLNNSLAMKQGVGSVTFARSTTATYIDRYGVLQYASIDEPRFEKDGLLIEGASTNLLTYSEDFTNAIWLKNNVTVGASAIEAPDGTTTKAFLLASTGTSNTNHIQQAYATSLVTTYTFSYYVKQFDTDTIAWGVYSTGGTTVNTLGFFTFSTKSATNSDKCKVVELANGWFRLEISHTTISGNTQVLPRIFPVNTTLTNSEASSVYIAFGQFEERPFATSYIPTTTTAVTRNADVCYTDGKNMPHLDDVTIAVDFDSFIVVDTATSLSPRVFEQVPNIRITCSSTENFFGQIGNSGTVYGYGLAPIQKQRAVLVSNNGSVDGASDGILFNDTETVSTPIPSGDLYLGSSVNGTNQLFGHIKNFRIWDKALTPTETSLA